MTSLDVFKIPGKVCEKTSEKPFIAFEYYPPKTETGVENLMKRMKRMKELGPLYVDVTWGAGGTTSDLTMDLCDRAQKEFGLVANMHLTCTNMPREKIDEAIRVAKEKDIKNILALRGDPPIGQKDWKPVESGFSCALDLIKYLREKAGDFFAITVAAYPEGHPTRIKKVEEGHALSETEKGRCVTLEDGVYVCSDKDFQEELEYLKKKVDAGAGMIVTQMFYDVDCFLAFVNACREYGITIPIIPGVMCVTSYGGFKRMGQLCKTRVPKDVAEMFESVKDDPHKVKQAGIHLGLQMSKKLLDSGIQGLHFYTLNLEDVVEGILKGLDMVESKDSENASEDN